MSYPQLNVRNQYPQLFHFSLEKLTEDRDFAHFFEDGSDKSDFKKIVTASKILVLTVIV